MKNLLLILLLAVTSCHASMAKSAEQAADRTVKIGIVIEPGKEGICSGALISGDGEVLTCAHCVAHHYAKLFVKLEDGTAYRAEVVTMDLTKDLALLKIKASTPFFTLGDDVARGDAVLAVGAPFGLQGTVTFGHVENKLYKDKLVTLHGAAINAGNSGGPLIDSHGRLVGINEGMIMANQLVPANGMFMAVDLSEIRTFLAGGI